MKKTIVLLLCLTLLALPVASLAELMYVTSRDGGGVHMRSGPSTDDDVITTIPFGRQVDVNTGFVDNPNWSAIDYNGRSGYMMNRYLTDRQPTPPAPAPTQKPSGGGGGGSSDTSLERSLGQVFSGFTHGEYQASVAPSTPTTFVNMRWAPTKSAPVRGQYWSGNLLNVLSHNGSWSEVYDPTTGTSGYMMTSFLTPSYGGGAQTGNVGGSDS